MPLAFDITFTVLYKCSGRVTTRFLKNNTRFLQSIDRASEGEYAPKGKRKRKIFLEVPYMLRQNLCNLDVERRT